MLATTSIVLLVAVLVLAGITVWMFFRWQAAGNLIAALDTRCETAFSDIDVHLKHRHDLIPRLVELLKSQASYEKEMLSAVTSAQTEALRAISPEIQLNAEKKLSAQVISLMSHVEKDPKLQSLPDYRNLRQEIVNCDNRITAARRFHNITVEEYNMSLSQWPASKIATRRRMNKREAFDLGLDRLLMDQPEALGM